MVFSSQYRNTNPAHKNSMLVTLKNLARKDSTYDPYDSFVTLESPKYDLFKLIQQYLLDQARH